MASNQDAINTLLRESAQSPLETAVKTEMKRCLQVSSTRMSALWTSWDKEAEVYRGWRMPDRADSNDVEKGQPPKIIVSVTYAKIQVLLSFLYSTFTQRNKFYELQGRSPQADLAASGMEIDLDWQMQYNKMIFKSYLWNLDALKMGFGVTKIEWGQDFEKRRVEKQVYASPFGGMMAGMGFPAKMKAVEEIMEIPIYEGNKIQNISPYSWFPDPDFSLAEFEKGAFVAHEEEESLTTLRAQEGRMYHGTNLIPRTYNDDIWAQRPRRTTLNNMGAGQDKSMLGRELQAIIRTEMVVSLTPKAFCQRHGLDSKIIGDEDYPVKFIATMANDQKLIRFERYNYLHNKFGYAFLEYSPDFNTWFNPGLSATIAPLQNYMTWLFNSHMAEVKKSLFNRFIYDPDAIEGDDIDSSKNIRIKSGVSGSIDNVIKQIMVQDMTRGHMADAEICYKFIDIVCGVNDNASGQYASGRRSAAESRSVNAGAATRMKMHATNMWVQGYQPLARQLIANTRQGRSRAFYQRILGDAAQQYPFEQCILTDPQQIAGEFDLIPYDATLGSDKDRQIQLLMEPLQMMLQNPAAAQLFGGNPGFLLDHIMQLAGINDWKRIIAGVGSGDPNAAAMASAATNPQISVVPDQQVQQAAQNGARPVDVSGEGVIQSLAGQGGQPQ